MKNVFRSNIEKIALVIWAILLVAAWFNVDTVTEAIHTLERLCK